MKMIEFTKGDLLTAEVEALVNTVNCVGIMGRGVALQFKERFPANFKAYETACRLEEVQPGRMFVYETGTLTNPKYIINFPTKRHWRGKSRMEDIDSGLRALESEIRNRGIKSIAIPPLGSGLGGLEWLDVRPRIEAALRDFNDLRVLVFEPNSTPANFKAREVPDMTAGRAALVALIHRYLGGLMDPSVSLLEVHKLMYFMQEAGEPLRLKYEKAPYGPYARNLSHVLKAIEGHLVSGYADGGDKPDKELELVPGAVMEAQTFLIDKLETVRRFDRVDSLVEGFETPFGLELLSTVHWVFVHEGAKSIDAATERVHGWNDHKKRFSPRQINIAYQRLSLNGWLPQLQSQHGSILGTVGVSGDTADDEVL
jgi:O-acetyl-ADP-ribose deacetylase (regulator of RNase III)